MHILLVDDDPAALAAQAALLQPPHRVCAFSDARRVAEALARERFDLVVTDLAMPEADGFQVLAAVQAAELPVPVIVVTAMDTARAALRALDMGAADYLVKPYEPDDLRRSVERCGRLASG